MFIINYLERVGEERIDLKSSEDNLKAKVWTKNSILAEGKTNNRAIQSKKEYRKKESSIFRDGIFLQMITKKSLQRNRKKYRFEE